MNRAGRLKRHQKVCADKRKFASRAATNHAIAELVRRGGALAEQREPYKCLACSMWHFGHRIGLGRKRGG